MRIIVGATRTVGFLFFPCGPALVVDAVAVGAGWHRIGFVIEQAFLHPIWELAIGILDAAPYGFVDKAFQFVNFRLVGAERLLHDGREPAAGTRFVAQTGKPRPRLLREELFGLVIVVDDRRRAAKRVAFIV